MKNFELSKTLLSYESNNPELTGSTHRLKISEKGILSRSKSNPFQKWNVVFVPYCSQDLWIGKSVRRLPNGKIIYFDGLNIFQNSLRRIFSMKNFKKTQKVMVTGISAGAVGVLANWKVLKKHFSKVKPKIKIRKRFDNLLYNLLCIFILFIFDVFLPKKNSNLKILKPW